MSSIFFKKMSLVLQDLVLRERRFQNSIGLLVFGSFVTGKVTKNSDLDLFSVINSGEYSRTLKKEKEITLEFYRWPFRLFHETIYGKGDDLYSKAFLFKILRTGKILYDPHKILLQAKAYTRSHRIPFSSIKLLIQDIKVTLLLAQKHLENLKRVQAEIVIRKSSENIARAMLLLRDVLEINPPKYYLPYLRREFSTFYRAFQVIHNLTNRKKNEIKEGINVIQKWCQFFNPSGKPVFHVHLENAAIETANAQDCLERGDYDAAILQVRYSALFLLAFILKDEKISRAPSEKVSTLLKRSHPFGPEFIKVMHLSSNIKKLRFELEYLKRMYSKLSSISDKAFQSKNLIEFDYENHGSFKTTLIDS